MSNTLSTWNAFDCLIATLPSLIAEVAFESYFYDPDDLYKFWVIFSLPGDVTEELVRLQLRFVDGQLYVHESHQHDPRLFKRIYGTIFAVIEYGIFM